MQKLILFVFLIFFGFMARAEYSESALTRYDHAVWGAIGFTDGGLSLGADYEFAADRTFGVGGLARFYKKDEDASANGVVVTGAFIRPHFHRQAWDLHVTVGAAIVNVDNASNGDDVTSLGPVWGLGLLYQLTETMAVGAENLSTAVWFDDDARGTVMEDIMFRMRFSF